MSAWKPGDVAMVRFGTSEWEVAIRQDDGGWSCCHRHDLRGHEDVLARRIVVIDPEDREQVKRLTDAMRANGWTGIDYEAPDDMQTVLRSLLAPPRPEEPLGHYAVVIAHGVAWCRAAWANDRPWNRMGTDIYADWDDMDVTRIEHKGVIA